MNMKSFLARLGFKRFAPPVAQPVRLPLLNTYPVAEHDIETELLCLHLQRMNDRDVSVKYHDLQNDMHLRIILRRLSLWGQGPRLDRRILILVCALTDRPAIATMWAYTLHRLIENLDASCSMLYFAEFLHLFEEGFPSEIGYHHAWLAQKAGPVNLLDTEEQWR